MSKSITSKNFFNILLFLFCAIASSLTISYFTKDFIALYNYKELAANYMNPIINAETLPWIILIFSFVILMMSNKKLYIATIMGISFLYVATTLDKDNYRKEIMQERYEYILFKDPAFEGTKNAELLRAAIKDNKPNDYINILKPVNDNQQPRAKELIRLFETIELVFPEYKEYTKSKLDDNFLSVNEYNDIKNMIIKNIPKKELTKEQLVIIGALK